MEQTATLAGHVDDDELLPWNDPEFVKAPWPWFDRLLRHHPVAQMQDGSVVVSKYADVMKYAKHPKLVAVPPDGIGDSPWAANLNSVLLTEGERHTRIRRSFSSWLTPKAVRTWGETAAESAAAALDQMGPDGVIEAHRALGVQPAQDAMARVLGVAREDGFPYIHATNLTMMAMGWSPSAEEVRRAHEGFGYMMFQAETLIEEKRRNPGDGMLLDEMIKAVDEGKLTERELKESVQILWGSAAHNPGQVMGSALVDLAAHPEVFQAYKDDVAAREPILNEAIRRSLPEVAIDRLSSLSAGENSMFVQVFSGTATTAARAVKVSPPSVVTVTVSPTCSTRDTGEDSRMSRPSAMALYRLAVPLASLIVGPLNRFQALLPQPVTQEMTCSAETSSGPIPKHRPAP